MNYDFIPSKFYREFAEKNELSFSDSARVSIILNNTLLTLGRKRALLDEIAASTDDVKLKDDLRAWAVRIDKALEEAHSRRGDEVYRLSIPDYDHETRIFSSFEAARNYERDHFDDGEKGFSVIKVKFSDEKTSILGEVEMCGVRFNKEREIMSVWCHDDTPPAMPRFGFIMVEDPFERGDIVRDIIAERSGSSRPPARTGKTCSRPAKEKSGWNSLTAPSSSNSYAKAGFITTMSRPCISKSYL